jgi:NAD(P)-dependent dehydrogenase (short-subunit alcohol dehydrogenase family)
MDLGLADETAVVTASSSGLGYASAASLAREGANVVICGRTPETLAAAEADLESVGDGDVLAVETDITEETDTAALVEATVAEFGGIDHVVTSAGGPPSGPFLDTSDGDWYDAYDLLVMSAVRVLRESHPHLVESDAGTVTAVTSTSVAEPIGGLVLSNAVRRAVIGLVKTVAEEWAPDVRANAVLPGPHETDRLRNLVEASVERGEFEDYETGLDAKADSVPLDRVGQPGELGDVVAFLASERASFVNGSSVPVEGGRLRG